MKSSLLIKGLVEMTFVLVNFSFSLPEWQAVKMTFFATWPPFICHVLSSLEISKIVSLWLTSVKITDIYIYHSSLLHF